MIDGPLLRALAGTQQSYAGLLPDRPAGMTGDDLPLYLVWRARPPTPVQIAFFNVRVGPREVDLARGADVDTAIQAQLLALRLDMLHHDGRRWIITEFHTQAGVAQFGRALAYPILLRQTYASTEPIAVHVVCYTTNPFLLPLFHDHHVHLFIAPTPGTPGTLTAL